MATAAAAPDRATEIGVATLVFLTLLWLLLLFIRGDALGRGGSSPHVSVFVDSCLCCCDGVWVSCLVAEPCMGSDAFLGGASSQARPIKGLAVAPDVGVGIVGVAAVNPPPFDTMGLPLHSEGLYGLRGSNAVVLLVLVVL